MISHTVFILYKFCLVDIPQICILKIDCRQSDVASSGRLAQGYLFKFW
jgi:hypothetical protein